MSITGSMGLPVAERPGRALGMPLPARSRLPTGLAFSATVYLLTRVPGLVAVAVYLHRTPGATLSGSALKWDGWWYVRIAQGGYSRSLRPPVTRPLDWHHQYSEWAFHPGYPIVIRIVHMITGSSYLAAAVGAAAGFGLLAVWAVHRLGATYGGERVGKGAAVLFAAWPGSAVLLQPYSEGLYIACAAAALTALLRGRWWVAGVLGAIACATRPTGVALLVAAAVTAAVRLVRQRDARALAAPALTALGLVAFAGYGWWRTGDPLVWRHAENLWAQKFDLSHKLALTTLHTVAHPGTALHTRGGRSALATTGLHLLGALAMIAVPVLARRLRHRLTLPLACYAAVSLALVVGYSAVAPRPRVLLAVLPAAVWAAAVLSRRAVIALAVGMTPLIGVVTYLWLWDVTP